jgi:MFS family permease
MAAATDRESETQRERLLWVLSAAMFLIFFQACMVGRSSFVSLRSSRFQVRRLASSPQPICCRMASRLFSAVCSRTGLGAGGVVPLALALMGALFPYEQRGGSSYANSTVLQ